MLKLVQLLTNASDDARRSVAGIEAANAAAEVEEHIAVDVDETCPLGALEEDAVPRLGNSGRDKTPALLEQSPAPGSGERRTDADRIACQSRHAQYQPIGFSFRLTCTCFISR